MTPDSSISSPSIFSVHHASTLAHHSSPMALSAADCSGKGKHMDKEKDNVKVKGKVNGEGEGQGKGKGEKKGQGKGKRGGHQGRRQGKGIVVNYGGQGRGKGGHEKGGQGKGKGVCCHYYCHWPCHYYCRWSPSLLLALRGISIPSSSCCRFFYIRGGARLITDYSLYVYSIEASDIKVGIVAGVFMGVAVVLRPFTGWFVDVSGRKPILIFSVIIFSLAGLGLPLWPAIVPIILFTGFFLFAPASGEEKGTQQTRDGHKGPRGGQIRLHRVL